MRKLKEMQQHWHERLLQKQLRRKQSVIRRSLDLASVTKIGILWEDNGSAEDRKYLRKWIEKNRKENKQVRTLIYFHDKVEHSEEAVHWFGRKQIDWFNRPKHPEVDEFIRQTFDLLLVPCRISRQSIEYIAALSQAAFRVGGQADKPYAFDLMIEYGEKMTLAEWLKQVEAMLALMKPYYAETTT